MLVHDVYIYGHIMCYYFRDPIAFLFGTIIVIDFSFYSSKREG
jgi:hypothetical protein